MRSVVTRIVMLFDGRHYAKLALKFKADQPAGGWAFDGEVPAGKGIPRRQSVCQRLSGQ